MITRSPLHTTTGGPGIVLQIEATRIRNRIFRYVQNIGNLFNQHNDIILFQSYLFTTTIPRAKPSAVTQCGLKQSADSVGHS